MKAPFILFLLIALIIAAPAVFAQDADSQPLTEEEIAEIVSVEEINPDLFDTLRYNTILSRLQSMGHGYYSDAEWKAVDDEVNALIQKARKARDGDAIIKTAVLKAMVLADMRRQYEPALVELRDARKIVTRMKNVDVSRLYVKEADVLAQMGAAPAIEKLIAEYKESPYYKPEPYAWAGGDGPRDPLIIVRPAVGGAATSLPLTMMEQSARLAQSAPGLIFPDVELQDIYGRTFRTSDFRGQIVLVDFFARGWATWERDLPQMRDIFDRHAHQGFSIISICLQANPAGIEQLGLPWHLVPSARQLTRALSVIEPVNFLLDREGTVIARNLRSGDLAAAVRLALERK